MRGSGLRRVQPYPTGAIGDRPWADSPCPLVPMLCGRAPSAKDSDICSDPAALAKPWTEVEQPVQSSFFCVAPGLTAVEPAMSTDFQGVRARHGRGVDRVPAGILDRSSAPDRALFRLDDDDFGKTFVILIQLGAILAMLSNYFAGYGASRSANSAVRATRRFVIGVLIAFLPATIIVAATHGFIKGMLFDRWVVCFTLILGGPVILMLDRPAGLGSALPGCDRVFAADDFAIGLAQCLAIIAGVSWSGNNVVSAMLLGADRRSAADFSFWFAIPTMGGALACDLYKNWAPVTARNTFLVAFGFVVFVRRRLDRGEDLGRLRSSVTVSGCSRRWRVVVGSLGLIGLALGYWKRRRERKTPVVRCPSPVNCPIFETATDGRRDRLDRDGVDAESQRCRLRAWLVRNDDVAVTSTWSGNISGAWQELQEGRLELGEPEWQRDQQPPAPDRGEHDSSARGSSAPRVRRARRWRRLGPAIDRGDGGRQRRRRRPAGISYARRRSAAAPARSAQARRSG